MQEANLEDKKENVKELLQVLKTGFCFFCHGPRLAAIAQNMENNWIARSGARQRPFSCSIQLTTFVRAFAQTFSKQ